MTEHPQEYVILGILMKQERHGYEIHTLLSSGLGHAWYAGISQVYALLKRLEAAEKVVSVVEQQDNRPAKHVYSITQKGREAFLQWVHTPLERMRDLRLEFLAKLFFIKELDLTGSDELIRKQKDIFQAQLRDIKQQDESCHEAFEHLVLHFRIGQIKAVLAWLQDCGQHINSTSRKDTL
ncbi:MAG: PadR family transcriptional regulator [Deltaproteobacteria bacterium]|nr:PadR family transcriptional regulator [Deltaproteobacteria bacterium]